VNRYSYLLTSLAFGVQVLDSPSRAVRLAREAANAQTRQALSQTFISGQKALISWTFS
jgi:hypothetical protein